MNNQQKEEIERMNKYKSAIEYFFNIMETGNIKDDRQQEVFELAIDALNYMNKESQ